MSHASEEPPVAPAFDWRARYRSGDTPWDLGEPHPELVRRLGLGELAPPRRGARAFVPGCGRGHDALLLARAGWRVTAVDMAPEVEPALRHALEQLGGELVIGDVLAFKTRRRFALLFEHTFFCALDPARRAEWGALARRLVAARGRVCALVFPCGKLASQGGPPFGIAAGDLATALGPGFELQCDEPVREHVQRRQWPERWAVLASRRLR